jgi:hypothetical protein
MASRAIAGKCANRAENLTQPSSSQQFGFIREELPREIAELRWDAISQDSPHGVDLVSPKCRRNVGHGSRKRTWPTWAPHHRASRSWPGRSSAVIRAGRGPRYHCSSSRTPRSSGRRTRAPLRLIDGSKSSASRQPEETKRQRVRRDDLGAGRKIDSGAALRRGGAYSAPRLRDSSTVADPSLDSAVGAVGHSRRFSDAWPVRRGHWRMANLVPSHRRRLIAARRS